MGHEDMLVIRVYFWNLSPNRVSILDYFLNFRRNRMFILKVSLRKPLILIYYCLKTKNTYKTIELPLLWSNSIDLYSKTGYGFLERFSLTGSEYQSFRGSGPHLFLLQAPLPTLGGGVNAGLEHSMPSLIFKRPKLGNNFIFRIVYFCFPSFLSLIFLSVIS